jgi:hypothetical protein
MLSERFSKEAGSVQFDKAALSGTAGPPAEPIGKNDMNSFAGYFPTKVQG